MRILNFVIFLLVFSASANAITEIKSMRLWPSPDNTRVVFDLNQHVKYKVYTMQNPERVVIDFVDSKLGTNFKKLSLNKTEIKKIRTGIHNNNLLRIVLDVTQPLKPKAYTLPSSSSNGPRLVIDLEYTSSKKTAPQILSIKARSFVVAIDPGHGGEDPGAIGPHGTKEKDVALAIAKYLKALIDKQPGMSAVLVRDGDYYVGLRQRMAKARSKHADLFLSIHADAYKNKQADGASVFVLSSRRASSEAARWLAASENRADLVGGVSLDDKSDVLASVLLDLSQTASAKASMSAAGSILKSMGKIAKLHKNSVESAGFMVLRSPDVPSILIETGFISNPKTEKKLRDKKYQKKIANSIMLGVKDYYKHKAH